MASSDVDACMDLQFEFRLAVWNIFLFFFKSRVKFPKPHFPNRMCV